MGRNLETLTHLFLAGAFPGRVAAQEPVSATRRSPDSSARKNLTRAQPAPVRRAARRRTTVPVLQEGKLTHPGEVLAQRLADLGLTASDLARDIDVPVNRVTAIINGQRGVTADTALRLGHWFDVEPEDWLGLQLEYEMALARRDFGAKVKKLPRLADRDA
jgi:antitoxin HigA-1